MTLMRTTILFAALACFSHAWSQAPKYLSVHLNYSHAGNLSYGNKLPEALLQLSKTGKLGTYEYQSKPQAGWNKVSYEQKRIAYETLLKGLSPYLNMDQIAFDIDPSSFMEGVNLYYTINALPENGKIKSKPEWVMINADYYTPEGETMNLQFVFRYNELAPLLDAYPGAFWHHPLNYADSISYTKAMEMGNYVADRIILVQEDLETQSIDDLESPSEEFTKLKQRIQNISQDTLLKTNTSIPLHLPLQTGYKINLQEPNNNPFNPNASRLLSNELYKLMKEGKLKGYQINSIYTTPTEISLADIEKVMGFYDSPSDKEVLEFLAGNEPSYRTVVEGTEFTKLQLYGQTVLRANGKTFTPLWLGIICKADFSRYEQDVPAVFFKFEEALNALATLGLKYWHHPDNRTDSCTLAQAFKEQRFSCEIFGLTDINLSDILYDVRPGSKEKDFVRNDQFASTLLANFKEERSKTDSAYTLPKASNQNGYYQEYKVYRQFDLKAQPDSIFTRKGSELSRKLIEAVQSQKITAYTWGEGNALVKANAEMFKKMISEETILTDSAFKTYNQFIPYKIEHMVQAQILETMTFTSPEGSPKRKKEFLLIYIPAALSKVDADQFIMAIRYSDLEQWLAQSTEGKKMLKALTKEKYKPLVYTVELQDHTILYDRESKVSFRTLPAFLQKMK